MARDLSLGRPVAQGLAKEFTYSHGFTSQYLQLFQDVGRLECVGEKKKPRRCGAKVRRLRLSVGFEFNNSSERKPLPGLFCS